MQWFLKRQIFEYLFVTAQLSRKEIDAEPKFHFCKSKIATFTALALQRLQFESVSKTWNLEILINPGNNAFRQRLLGFNFY